MQVDRGEINHLRLDLYLPPFFYSEKELDWTVKYAFEDTSLSIGEFWIKLNHNSSTLFPSSLTPNIIDLIQPHIDYHFFKCSQCSCWRKHSNQTEGRNWCIFCNEEEENQS